MEPTWIEAFVAKNKPLDRVALFLKTLQEQGVAVSQEHHALLENCPDLPVLHAWLDRYLGLSLAQDLVDSITYSQKPSAQAKLTVFSRTDTLREYAEMVFSLENDCDIGRGPLNSVMLTSMTVSRKHCRITRKGEDFFIEDLQSVSGTVLNHKRVDAQTKLANGDVIEIGDKTLVFEKAT